jgi:zinc protease
MQFSKRSLSLTIEMKDIFLMIAAFACVAIFGSVAPEASAQAQEKSAELGKIERLNRAPVNKEVLRVELPRPEVVKLPNGLTLVLLENHKLPTVSFSLWVSPGQLADPKETPGLASFTADMLTEGTERRNSSQIATESDSLGISLNTLANFGTSYSTVASSGLIDVAPQILDLMSDVVLHPSFPSDELEKYKQRKLADLEQQLTNPGFLGNREFREIIYGDFAASVTSATKESINKVTAEDLKRYHGMHYPPGNAILGATGDFKSADMRALIEKYFGAWSGAAEPALKAPEAPAPQPMKITLVDRPASVQTYIIAGDRAIRRNDPAFYGLTVMNQILGNGPQARLFLDLREIHGYTYGAYSRFRSEVYPGEWSAASPVRTPVTDGSMTQFLYEFKKINDEPVPQGELEEAERAIIANFALSLEQPNQLLNNWLSVQHFHLSPDYWDKYPDNISKIDAGTVEATAKKYVDVAHLQWVCVGDRKQIESVLKKYGPVTVVDAEGKPEN